MDEGIFDIKEAHKLDNPRRIRDLRPQELLKDVAGVTNGNTCVDFGSGTGIFALPMAELVGAEGRVYAVDNSVEMLAHIRAKNPPTNLMLLHSDAERTGLNSQIADVCLLAFILHEVKEPAKLISEAIRLLKPEGRIIVVEWNPNFDSPRPPQKKRLSIRQVDQLFEQSGLTLVSHMSWTKKHYVAVGKLKIAATGPEPISYL